MCAFDKAASCIPARPSRARRLLASVGAHERLVVIAGKRLVVRAHRRLSARARRRAAVGAFLLDVRRGARRGLATGASRRHVALAARREAPVWKRTGRRFRTGAKPTVCGESWASFPLSIPWASSGFVGTNVAQAPNGAHGPMLLTPATRRGGPPGGHGEHAGLQVRWARGHDYPLRQGCR